jgi:hypothetical protein
MAGPVRVENHDVYVRIIKRRVVVSTVPNNDIRFFFRRFENSLIVDTGIDHDTLGHQGFVFFSFLYGTLLVY